MPLVSSIIGPLSGRWADRIGGKIPASLGLAAQALALLVLFTLTPTTPYPVLALALVIMGVGSGLFWSPNTSTTMGAAPRNRLGVASATLNTMRKVGMVFSYALALAVAAASMPPAVMNAVFLGTVGHLASDISADFTNGMVHAFLVSVVICALAVVFSLVREGRRPATAATLETPAARSEARSEESAGARTAGGQ
jgi:MFS family permease